MSRLLNTLLLTLCATATPVLATEAFLNSIWDGLTSWLTTAPQFDTSSVNFVFIDSDNPDVAPLVVKKASEVLYYFDPALETVVLIHGYNDNYYDSNFLSALIKAYTSRGPPRNLVVVDWSDLAKAPYYKVAKDNTYSVGLQLSYFLQEMETVRWLEMATLEMVGFSLGAHLAGVASADLPRKPRRIIGLDPAALDFDASLLTNEASYKYTLDKTDAPLVEIVHTCAGTELDPKLGTTRSLGHRDFYPNGGHEPMPGCGFLDFEDIDGYCSHTKAYWYFSEALTNEAGFIATQCTSWIYYTDDLCSDWPRLSMVNWDFDMTLVGNFYLATNSESPYAIQP